MKISQLLLLTILLLNGAVALYSQSLLNRRRSSNDYCLTNSNWNQVSLMAATCSGANNQYFSHDINNRLVMVAFSGKCVETSGVVGSNVYLEICSSSNNQIWDWDNQERLRLRSNSSLCLDLAGSSTANNVQVILQLCSSSSGQKWYRPTCGLGMGCDCPYNIASCRNQLWLRNNGLSTVGELCLESSLQANLVGNVCSSSSNNNSMQMFSYDSQMRLSLTNGFCVDIIDESLQIITSPCNSSNPQQKWQFDELNRVKSFTNPALCLDFPLSKSQVGASVTVRPCSSEATQKWVRVFCAIGYTANETMGCNLCPIGQFKNVTGNTNCQPCLNDLYTTPTRDRCELPDRFYGYEMLAGNDMAGFQDGQGTMAQFKLPQSLTIDTLTNDFYVADSGNNVIRRINASGYVSTVIGSTSGGDRDGQGSNALLRWPNCLTQISQTSTFILTDLSNHKIRIFNTTTLQVETFAGFLGTGSNDGPLAIAKFKYPRMALYDNQTRSIFVTDQNHKVRLILPNGTVTTFAGTGTSGSTNGHRLSTATFNTPYHMIMDDSRSLYVGEPFNHAIRRIDATTGMVSTFVGGVCGYGNGIGTSAPLCNPTGMVIDNKLRVMYVNDRTYFRIRAISMDTFMVKTIPVLGLNGNSHLTADGNGNFYVVNQDGHNIMRFFPCPVNSIWNHTLGKSCLCNPGYEMNQSNNTCTPCPDRTWKDNYGNEKCQGCPLGTILLNVANRTCMDCPAGKDRSSFDLIDCQDCQPGYFKSSSGSASCSQCPVGWFSVGLGSLNCSACPLQTESNSNRTSCVECPAGMDRWSLSINRCMNCPLGFFKNATGRFNCSPCSIGMESSPDFTRCVECSNGKYRPSLENSTCIECPTNAVCTLTQFMCTPGYTAIDQSCHQCPDGYFKPSIGNTHCLPCSTGTFSSDDYQQCVVCPAGYSSADGSCKRCGIGKQPNYNRTLCISCPFGSFKSDNTTNACVKCPTGATCTPTEFICDSGFSLSFNGKGCGLCPVGYYKSISGNEQACTACPAGTQSGNSRKQCEPCPSHQYRSPESTNPYCIDCPAYASECKATGFQCIDGYIINRDKNGCEPKGFIVADGSTILETDEYQTTLPTIDDNNRRTAGFAWERFYLYPITYAIIVPIIVFLSIIGLLMYSNGIKWLAKEKTRFGDMHELNKTTAISQVDILNTTNTAAFETEFTSE